MSSQVRIQPDSGRLLGRPLELADLAQRGLAHLLGQLGGFDAGAVVVGPFGLALAQFLADGGELLAQQELALPLVHALADVVADLLGDLELGEVLARPAEDEVQPGLDVGGLQQLALLLVGEVGGVAGGVGELGRVGDPLHGVDDLPGVAALQDRDDELLVLGGELADLLGDRRVLDRLGLDPQRGAGAGHAGAEPGPAAGAQHRGGRTAGQPADLLDRGDHAVGRVAVGQARARAAAGRPSRRGRRRSRPARRCPARPARPCRAARRSGSDRIGRVSTS